jgi:hypothetical protein
MMYFRGNDFYPFALDWQEQSNGRQVVPGLGIYFLDPSEGRWTTEEVERQLYFLRRHRFSGEGMYRAGFLMKNTQGIYDLLKTTFYTTPALQPAMPWLDNVPPASPQGLQVTTEPSGSAQLNWQAATDNDERNAPTYVVYGSDTYPVDTSNPENIIAQGIRATSYRYVPVYPWAIKSFFTVTAVDRYGNESQ